MPINKLLTRSLFSLPHQRFITPLQKAPDTKCGPDRLWQPRAAFQMAGGGDGGGWQITGMTPPPHLLRAFGSQDGKYPPTSSKPSKEKTLPAVAWSGKGSLCQAIQQVSSAEDSHLVASGPQPDSQGNFIQPRQSMNL